MYHECHRKRIKHFHRPDDLDELTLSCYRRMRLLTNDGQLSELSEFIDAANGYDVFELVVFIYMPKHLHFWVSPVKSEPGTGRQLAAIKITL